MTRDPLVRRLVRESGELRGEDWRRGPARRAAVRKLERWVAVGDLDLSEHLSKYQEQELVVIIASIGPAGEVDKERYVCGICGFALTGLGECPRCRLQTRERAKGLRRRAGRRSLFREIGGVVEESWEEEGR